MDYREMTAPCGLDCFNCTFSLAPENPDAQTQIEKWSQGHDIPLEIMQCRGCRTHNGRIPLQTCLFGESHRCAAYECAKRKGNHLCGDCEDFPCNHVHPSADKADELPHNIKVFNLCLINKMGIEKWAGSKAAEVRQVYFTTPWSLPE
jgi:hypothetical protein